MEATKVNDLRKVVLKLANALKFEVPPVQRRCSDDWKRRVNSMSFDYLKREFTILLARAGFRRIARFYRLMFRDSSSALLLAGEFVTRHGMQNLTCLRNLMGAYEAQMAFDVQREEHSCDLVESDEAMPVAESESDFEENGNVSMEMNTSRDNLHAIPPQNEGVDIENDGDVEIPPQNEGVDIESDRAQESSDEELISSSDDEETIEKSSAFRKFISNFGEPSTATLRLLLSSPPPSSPRDTEGMENATAVSIEESDERGERADSPANESREEDEESPERRSERAVRRAAFHQFFWEQSP